MKVIVTKDYQETCKVVANMIVEQVNLKPDSKLGLATGGTAEMVYDYLSTAYDEKKVDFSSVMTVNLDEYMGVASDSPVSYADYMKKRFFSKVNIDMENTYIPSGIEEEEKELDTFNDKLYSGGGIDLQLLGVGANGHIGFNEPGEKLIAGVHVTPLSDSTVEANSRYFDNREMVPKRAITMGVGDIMKAKRIVVAATGDAKIVPISYLLNNDEVSTKVPISMLKMHRDVTVVIDKELYEKIKL